MCSLFSVQEDFQHQVPTQFIHPSSFLILASMLNEVRGREIHGSTGERMPFAKDLH